MDWNAIDCNLIDCNGLMGEMCARCVQSSFGLKSSVTKSNHHYCKFVLFRWSSVSDFVWKEQPQLQIINLLPVQERLPVLLKENWKNKTKQNICVNCEVDWNVLINRCCCWSTMTVLMITLTHVYRLVLTVEEEEIFSLDFNNNKKVCVSQSSCICSTFEPLRTG